MATRTRHPGAQEFLPASEELAALAAAAASCRGCDLYEQATQTVFGAGPGSARLMLVGEQPGDVEDAEGRPFVGPAGKLLRDAIEESGLDGVPTYVTNAVKHFRFTRRGQAPHPREADGRALHGVPAVARGRAARCPSDGGGGVGRHCGRIATRSRLPADPAPRRGAGLAAGRRPVPG